jgi:Uma2 family endonuclease
MAMPVKVQRYTVDEIESWPEDGNRYELLDGFLLVTSAPGSSHQIVATRIAGFLLNSIEGSANLWVSAPGVIIRRPKTELVPDVLVFRAPGPLPKWDKVREHLLAVEAESRSTKRYDRDNKRPAYLTLGVARVWRVVPDDRAIWVSDDAGEERCHRKPFRWAPPGCDRSFLVPVADFFRGLD